MQLCYARIYRSSWCLPLSDLAYDGDHGMVNGGYAYWWRVQPLDLYIDGGLSWYQGQGRHGARPLGLLFLSFILTLILVRVLVLFCIEFAFPPLLRTKLHINKLGLESLVY